MGKKLPPNVKEGKKLLEQAVTITDDLEAKAECYMDGFDLLTEASTGERRNTQIYNYIKDLIYSYAKRLLKELPTLPVNNSDLWLNFMIAFNMLGDHLNEILFEELTYKKNYDQFRKMY